MYQDIALQASGAEAQKFTDAIAKARAALLAKKDSGGWWCFEFEADVTIPAEYILLLHFLGKPEPDLELRIGRYIRRIQSKDGSWPLYPEGEGNLSCMAGRNGSTCSRVSLWRCSARSPIARFRRCRRKSSCCRCGSRSTCIISRRGRAR
jgi:hypothetical protein